MNISLAVITTYCHKQYEFEYESDYPPGLRSTEMMQSDAGLGIKSIHPNRGGTITILLQNMVCDILATSRHLPR
jgi:hypothetical protein